MIGKVLRDPYRLILHFWALCYVRILRLKKNVQIGESVKLIGKPLLDVHPAGKLVVGDRVTLNSRNRKYHVNMHSPVKIYVDGKDAVVTIGCDSRIHGSCIHAYERVTIGKRCLIAANTNIIDCNGHDLCLDEPCERINTTGKIRPVSIGDDVWIGANCMILPGVTIGDGAVIGANSVVSGDVPKSAVASGNPLTIRRREPS